MPKPVPDKAEQKRLVEDMGIVFEDFGIPRMAGRILGWLLMCNPPYQSAAELSAEVEGSKGSISSMTRMLAQAGFVERMGLPGSRITYYRIKPGCWWELLRSRIAFLSAMRDLAERGLALMADEEPGLRLRLEELHNFYSFIDHEMPVLLEHWQKQRGRVAPRQEIARI